MQFPAGQVARTQRIEQLRRVLGVGARQRGEHPCGRPGGHRAFAHRREQRVGQRAEESQPSTDPAHIATTAARDLALGESLTVDQFAQQ